MWIDETWPLAKSNFYYLTLNRRISSLPSQKSKRRPQRLRRTVVPTGLKPAEKKFTKSDFTRFSKQVSANSHNFRFRSLRVLHIQKISNCCMHKYNRVNFTNFLNIISGGFFAIRPNCGPEAPRLRAKLCFAMLKQAWYPRPLSLVHSLFILLRSYFCWKAYTYIVGNIDSR